MTHEERKERLSGTAARHQRGLEPPEGATMNDDTHKADTQKALAVLTEIAEDENCDADVRIRAACAILGHAESVRQGHTAPVPA